MGAVKELWGIAASPGIAIGKAYVYMDSDVSVPEYAILEHEVVLEMRRYEIAVTRAVADLETLKGENPQSEEHSFLDSHILMLQDPEFRDKIDNRMGRMLKNVEWVLLEEINELVDKLNSLQDIYLRERALDLKDVSRRVLDHLLCRNKTSLADLKEEVVLVCSNLMPSDAVAMNKRLVKAIAMDTGGRTTHTAILARSFEIPAVLGIRSATREIRGGDMLVVDGSAGQVFVNPSPEILETYRRRQADYLRHLDDLVNLRSLPGTTTDGRILQLKSNIETPEEFVSALTHGADGIGLYRSEFLFIKDGMDVLEETQYAAYTTVLRGMADKPVTIRTLDLGGDKLTRDMHSEAKEANPILGWRAIRFCLSHKDMFRTQLRALLRASVHGDLRIMFPLVSGTGELDEVFAILEEVKKDLRNQGIPYKDNIPLGTMIEVPSAAMVSDHLAKMVDFFSIGTNDLIQYTLAVDRGNEKIAHLFVPFHPGVIRLIKLVTDNAHKEGIPVGMCGEMAADPAAAVLLLGLGVDEFSMSPLGLPKIKKILRTLSFSEAQKVAEKALEMSSAAEIERYLKSYLRGLFDDDDSLS